MPRRQKDERTACCPRWCKFVSEPDDQLGRSRRAGERSRERYSKQMLKEMIERKRRNDFVRKREFDMLRKMRREG